MTNLMNRTLFGQSSLRAATPDELGAIADAVVGRSCDLRGMALDDQGGKVHVLLVDRSGTGAVSELIVRRVTEFSAYAPRGSRLFDVDGLSYDERSRRVLLRSDAGLDVIVTVDRLDVALRPRRRRRS
jgi:hypothetical protein